MLTAQPEIKAFYAQNDVMAFGVAAAIQQKGLTGQVLLVGTDGIPQAKKEIAAGNMTATVSERPIDRREPRACTRRSGCSTGKAVPGWIDVPAFIIDERNVVSTRTACRSGATRTVRRVRR